MKIELDPDFCLHPLQPTYAKSLFGILTGYRSHFSRWLPFVNDLFNIEQTEKYIRESQLLWAAKRDFSFAILKNNRARGLISAKDLNWLEKSTELGYWLDPTLQNKGIITNALNCLIEFLIREHGFRTFWIKCAQSNLSSQRVAIKAGFALMGVESREGRENAEIFHIYCREA